MSPLILQQIKFWNKILKKTPRGIFMEDNKLKERQKLTTVSCIYGIWSSWKIPLLSVIILAMIAVDW